MITRGRKFFPLILILFFTTCERRVNEDEIKKKVQSINLVRGEVALCGGGQLGNVDFSLSCAESVRDDFNLGISLLHSFEYADAEKVFAKVIDADPKCVMAYWAAAMSNFHPLWAPPTRDDLQKGASLIAIARLLEKSEREREYVEAIATIFDDWDKISHKARALKFEKATEAIYVKYSDDKEAAIFYSLALVATADPTDKSFINQKKAGEILKKAFANQPDHPGVAHYLIHTYDYPELASLGLPAARSYAAIASASAHAQHMPSHIFTRLGLWQEAANSNLKSISAAVCYAEQFGIKGHWDEELHGIDYAVYAFLQQGKDREAQEQLQHLGSITSISPLNFKVAYAFAAIPTRVALETKRWEQAARLEFMPADFPWEDFLWQKAIVHFGRSLGGVRTGDLRLAEKEIDELRAIHSKLAANPEKNYEANQVLIQVKTAEAWLNFASGKNEIAVKLMTEAADMEDATAKHPVTPGEVIPARELLGDMFLEMRKWDKALEAYEADLARHPNRYNGLYGAALSAKRVGDETKSSSYLQQLKLISNGSSRVGSFAIATAF